MGEGMHGGGGGGGGVGCNQQGACSKGLNGE